MISGRSVKSKTITNNWFLYGFVQFVFLSQVGPRDQTSEVFGPQNGPESELWSDISGPKIDKNSVSKTKRSKMKKSEVPGYLATNDRRHFGDILDPRVLGNEHCL